MSTVTTSPEARASPFFRQLSQLSVGEVAALWRQYLVFTVTRDPLDRAVSQYSFLMRSNLADPPGCAAAVGGIRGVVWGSRRLCAASQPGRRHMPAAARCALSLTTAPCLCPCPAGQPAAVVGPLLLHARQPGALLRPLPRLLQAGRGWRVIRRSGLQAGPHPAAGALHDDTGRRVRAWCWRGAAGGALLLGPPCRAFRGALGCTSMPARLPPTAWRWTLWRGRSTWATTWATWSMPSMRGGARVSDPRQSYGPPGFGLYVQPWAPCPMPVPPRQPSPAGVPALQLGAQLGTAKMRARCASGRSGAAAAHGAAEMEQGAWRWQGMVAREQYCTTDEYYAGRHAHCRASVAAYYADDLRLLYGSG